MTAAAPQPDAAPTDGALTDKALAKTVLLVCGDLMTGGPLVQAVRHAGMTPRRALSVAKAEIGDAAAIVLDLSLPGAAAWLAGLPETAPPALAFGPHVLTDLLQTAREANRGPVLTRSQLAASVPAWLDGLT